MADETLSLELREALKQRDEARAQLLAYLGNVAEMSIGVGLPSIFRIMVGTVVGTVEISLTPETAKPFYEAVRVKWEKDQDSLVRLYEGYYDKNLQLHRIIEDIRHLQPPISSPHGEQWNDGYATALAVCKNITHKVE